MKPAGGRPPSESERGWGPASTDERRQMAAILRCIFGVVALIAIASSTSAQRDARTTPAAGGTAAISGTVMLDDASPRPVRRARVTLNSFDRTIGRTVITDDSGTFAFRGLPAGRYSLAATKEAHATVQYGARGYGRQGTPIVLADGQQLGKLVLKMTRGSVITGMLLDHDGQPFPGVSVRAMRYAFVGGERRLSPGGGASTTADDRGVYRIYGLAAGDYVVVATASGPGMQAIGDVALISDADVRRALAEAAQPAAAARATPGTTAPAADAGQNEPQRRATYAAVFYPGTTVATQAATVTVGTAEERGGIDFQLQLVPTATVEGTVTAPEGLSVGGLTVSMMINSMTATLGLFEGGFKTTRTRAGGRFSFPSVTPGQYTVVVRGNPSKTAASSGSNLWATADVAVDGSDVSGLSLTLQPGLSVSGRVQFDGSTLQPPDRARIRIMASSAQGANDVSVGVPPVQPDVSGHFTLTGLAPGRYRFTASLAGNRPDTGWALRSSVLDNRDTLDSPIDLRQSVEGVTITFTDHPTEISGLVRDERGQAAPEYSVIVFARDSAAWTPGTRRVLTVRPAADGRFTARGLPPGDYLIALALDPEPGQTTDPSFLQRLAASAVPITLAESGKKTQDLQVTSGTETR